LLDDVIVKKLTITNYNKVLNECVIIDERHGSNTH